MQLKFLFGCIDCNYSRQVQQQSCVRKFGLIPLYPTDCPFVHPSLLSENLENSAKSWTKVGNSPIIRFTHPSNPDSRLEYSFIILFIRFEYDVYCLFNWCKISFLGKEFSWQVTVNIGNWINWCWQDKIHQIRPDRSFKWFRLIYSNCNSIK